MLGFQSELSSEIANIFAIWQNLKYVIREKFYFLLNLVCANFEVKPTTNKMNLPISLFASENLMLDPLTYAVSTISGGWCGAIVG